MNPQNKDNQRVSLLLLTHNEEENIKKHFNWLAKCPVINEIVVVDDNSTDKTKDILMSLKNPELSINFHSRGLNSDFSAQRQFAISKTKNDWVFWLDADEVPEPKLIDFLNHLDFSSLSNYAFYRDDTFLGSKLKHGETATQLFTRLLNKNQGKFTGRVHEIWESSLPTINTQTHLRHYSHHTLKSFFQKIDQYTTIRSQELFDQKVTVNTFQIISYPIGKFIVDYVFKLGILDSTPGIIFALGMSFHSFLVRAKLWHLYHP